MKKTLAIIAILGLFASTAFAQTKSKRQVVNLKGSAVTNQTKNSHITTAKPTSDTKSKTRGANYDCSFSVHNTTDYCIDVYVDGTWVFTLGAYGDGTVYAWQGWQSLYGVSCGGTEEWSGSGIDCGTQSDYYFNP